jgi:hypothetical protein
MQLILERLERMERNFDTRLEDHMRETDTKIQGLNALIIQSTSPRRSRPISPTPLPRGQTPPQDDEDDDIYGHPNPPRTYKPTPKPFPPQDAPVSTNPERFYANYAPLPQSSQHPSRQQSRQPSYQPQQPFQLPRPPRSPFQAYSPYPPQDQVREKTPRPNDIAPYEGESGRNAVPMRLGLKPPSFQGHHTEDFAAWIYTVELYFYTNKLPGDEYFLNGTLCFWSFF